MIIPRIASPLGRINKWLSGMICPRLSGPISILELAAKEEWNIGKLREAEIALEQGGTVADACRRIGATEQSYYRWRKEYGGLKMDQARRMKDLEGENARLRRRYRT